MIDGPNGNRIDPDYHDRLWGNGLLGTHPHA